MYAEIYFVLATYFVLILVLIEWFYCNRCTPNARRGYI